MVGEEDDPRNDTKGKDTKRHEQICSSSPAKLFSVPGDGLFPGLLELWTVTELQVGTADAQTSARVGNRDRSVPLRLPDAV
jgi:hypothetical protein